MAPNLRRTANGRRPFREEASLLQNIADAQMLAGDISGAHDSLVRARGLTKDNASLGYIAVEEANIGDASEAKTTLELISDAGTRSSQCENSVLPYVGGSDR